ncbi:MAG TPA: DUF2950 domain-containing protein [Opitutaceae bacterium]|jgi:hypothetical protein
MKLSILQQGTRLCRAAALAALLAAPAMLAQDGPLRFGSPKEAAAALAAAAKSGDRHNVDRIFGPDVAQLRSGDEKQDQVEFKGFSRSIGRFWRVVRQSDDRYVLDIGDEDWPLPIPIVRQGSQWYFDTAVGKDEILNRRIGEDELTAIGVCRTYVIAQHEYSSEDRDGSGILKYAQHLKSTEGTKDGLYWKASPTEEESPFGPLVAEARAQGYTGHDENGGPRPFHGYRFKVLTAQGGDAPGGAFSYIINGNMVAGFALVAYPARWGESGVMTFVVNQWGKVYQRNLGADSAQIASAMTEFNPGDGWTVVGSP